MTFGAVAIGVGTSVAAGVATSQINKAISGGGGGSAPGTSSTPGDPNYWGSYPTMSPLASQSANAYEGWLAGSNLPGGLISSAQNANSKDQGYADYLSGLAPGAVASGQQTQQALQGYGNTIAGYGNQVAGHGYESLPAAYQAMNADYGMAGQIYNTAFDPQQALYNRTQQQVSDQTNAQLAARGIEMGGVGVGIAGQSANNFNIDWQNQQLARQAQGGQAAQGLYSAGLGGLDQALSTGASTMTAAGNMQNQAGNLYNEGNQAYLSGLGTAGQLTNSASNTLGNGVNALNAGAEGLGNMYRTESALALAPYGQQLDATKLQNAQAQGIFGNNNANAAGAAGFGQQIGNGLGKAANAYFGQRGGDGLTYGATGAPADFNSYGANPGAITWNS